MARLDSFLKLVAEQQASDLHFHAGGVPMIRHDGELLPLPFRSLSELEQGLAPELIDELERITLPFGDEAPSDAELRIAQAQLVGWLEGLFHGIQATLFAQQMTARGQLEEMRRRALPGRPGQPGDPSGQYL